MTTPWLDATRARLRGCGSAAAVALRIACLVGCGARSELRVPDHDAARSADVPTAGAPDVVRADVTPVVCPPTEPGADFRVLALQSSGCLVGPTYRGAIAGDDRGGIGAGTQFFWYTGDTTSARFTLPDALGPQVGASGRHDGIFSNVRDGTIYTLWNASLGAEPRFGNGAYVLTHLAVVDEATGERTSRSLALSTPITFQTDDAADHSWGPVVTDGTGIFAGYDRVVFLTGGHWYEVALGDGTVTDHGPAPAVPHVGCESWAFWGLAERFGGDVYVDYIATHQTIVRRRLRDGATTTLATFDDLGDMCGFTFSVCQSRWIWHIETNSQFSPPPWPASTDEICGTCPATWDHG